MSHCSFSCICLLSALVAVSGLHAQPGIFIGTGDNVFISTGTLFSTDSLALIPSAGFNLQGINGIRKTTTLAHPSTNLFIQRVFQFSNTSLPFSGSISMHYKDGELNGIAETNLTLNIHNGSNWNSFNSNVTRDAVNNLVSTGNLDNIALNELTLASLFAPLPVKFSAVSAVCKTNGILVNWTTLSETNSDHFEVQWSADGIAWHTKRIVAAAGFSAGPRNYQWLDSAAADNNSYRIVESGADGRTTTSAVVKTNCLLSSAVSVFPNPVRSAAWLSIRSAISKVVVISMYDAGGALLAMRQVALTPGLNTFAVDLQPFAGGWYTISIAMDATTQNLKILKQ